MLAYPIVDDHESVRRGVRSLLSAREEWFVCGEAEDSVANEPLCPRFCQPVHPLQRSLL